MRWPVAFVGIDAILAPQGLYLPPGQTRQVVAPLFANPHLTVSLSSYPQCPLHQYTMMTTICNIRSPYPDFPLTLVTFNQNSVARSHCWLGPTPRLVGPSDFVFSTTHSHVACDLASLLTRGMSQSSILPLVVVIDLPLFDSREREHCAVRRRYDLTNGDFSIFDPLSASLGSN